MNRHRIIAYHLLTAGLVLAALAAIPPAFADFAPSRVLRGKVDQQGRVEIEIGTRRIEGRNYRVYRTRFRNIGMRCSNRTLRRTSFGATEIIRFDSAHRRKLSSGARSEGSTGRSGWEYHSEVDRWSHASGTLKAFEIERGGKHRVACRTGALSWSATTR